jgi:hypothetical protein
MSSASSDNWREKLPKQPSENWPKKSPKQSRKKSSEESSEKSSANCVECHNKTCSFRYKCRFLWNGNCKHDRACTCTGTLVCEPSASGGSAVKKQPDPVPVTEIVSAKVDASSDDLDDASYCSYGLDAVKEIGMTIDLVDKSNTGFFDFQRKNGILVMVDDELDGYRTFRKINRSIDEEQPFNQNFDETDEDFISDTGNNRKIARFLAILCHNLIKKITVGMVTLEKCKEIMEPAKDLFSSGSSPAHVAAAVGDSKLASLLIILGFDLNKKNLRGYTAVDMFERIHQIYTFSI